MAFELRRRSAVASSALPQDWVARIRAGDEAAFEAMFRAYYDQLCRYVAAYLGSRDAAEDAVQGVFARLWEDRAHWAVGEVRHYLYAAVRRRAISQIRRRAVQERTAVEAWLGADAERCAAVVALQAASAADTRHHQAPYDTDAAWRRFRHRVGRTTRLAAPVPARWRLPAIAAGLVALLGVGGVWWLGAHAVARAPALRDYATPRGRRAVFRLLDGTEITLNADSRLRVPVRFGARQRDVYLDGEAYFSVVHDAARSFVVHTARSAIRDVGTRFGVHAYADGAGDRVAVAEGTVAVAVPAAPAAGETPLRAGQVATLSSAGAVHVLRGANVTAELAWTRGRLVFGSLPLGEAAQRLGRWYDLDVRVADSELAHRPVTGSYGDEPVTQVLTLITAAVGARYEWRGRSVTISTANGPR